MDTIKDYKRMISRTKAIRKRMSKVKVGLPKTVTFVYSKGIVECYPKDRKWIVKVNGKKPVNHFISPEHRLDVTKYKARHLLKLAIIGLLRTD